MKINVNTSWVKGFKCSWVGDRSREVVRFYFSCMALVDLIFFCWMRRWPLLAAMGFLRCFEMREDV